jgi:hypothetical protein
MRRRIALTNTPRIGFTKFGVLVAYCPNTPAYCQYTTNTPSPKFVNSLGPIWGHYAGVLVKKKWRIGGVLPNTPAYWQSANGVSAPHS